MNLETNDFNTPNKAKIIGIIIAIVIILVLCLMIFGGRDSSSGGNGYTAKYGETLKINELNDNFDIEVISVEKNYHIHDEYDLVDTKGIAVKVRIKNNSDDALDIGLANFKLLDSSNNEIDTASPIFDSTLEGALNYEISGGQSESGYLFFYDNDSDENSFGSNFSKLEINVLKHVEKYGDDGVRGEYEQYYIMLK